MALTPLQHAYYLINSVLSGTNYERRRLWYIWASKYRQCPKCGQPEFKPCLNMTLLRKMPSRQVPTQNPHSERIDPYRLAEGLLQRGYIQPSTYAQFLKDIQP